MTTTQPFTAEDIQSTPAEDQMEMAASPYAQYDDIDFDLDDDLEKFMANDSMTDEITNTEVKDDPMKDSSVNNDMAEDEVDFVMEPDEDTGYNEEIFEQPDMDEELFDKPSNMEENFATANNPPVGDEKLLEDDTIAEDEDLLFEEEETTDHDTNNAPIQSTTITTAADPKQHKSDPKAQTTDESTNLTATSSEKSTISIVDFAVAKPPTPIAAIDNSEMNDKITSDEGNTSSVAVTDPADQVDTSGSQNGIIDKGVPANQPPDIVPDDSDSEEEHNSTFNRTAGTHLHPITLRYQDQDMSLFPPLEEDDSATYFLGESSLAFESIDKLLSSCRELLGESIGHDDEMVIDIPSLGLHICEDSKYATQLTLAQIVDTYMLLSQNENLNPIKPLNCELTHRVCLTTQMAYLANSAREGKTYSDIVSEHVDTPAFGDDAAEYDDITSYQNIAKEADDGEESIGNTTTDATQHFDPAATINDPQSLPKQSRQSSHDTRAEDLAQPKSPGPPNGSNVHQAESFPVDNSTTDELALAADHNDAESQSSHTLEGDEEEIPQLDAEDFDPEETELLETDEFDLGLETDGYDEHEVTKPEPSTATEPADNFHNYKKTTTGHAEQDVSQSETIPDDVFEFDDFVDKSVSSGALLATPSKNSNGKRKFPDDEEDFLEIDISTPEPKRARPA